MFHLHKSLSHLLISKYHSCFCRMSNVNKLIRICQYLCWRRQWHSTPVLLPGKIPWMEEPGGLQSMGSLRVGQDWATSLSLFTFTHWRRQWQPTPVLLPGKIPWMEEPGRLLFMGLQRVRHDWVTSLSLFTFLHWRRKWQPTPVFLPGESQGQGNLVGCHLWGCAESDTTEAT